MPISSRGESLFSVGVLPSLMGLGHLAPVLGSIYAATGDFQHSLPLLAMLGTGAALVDCEYTHQVMNIASLQCSSIIHLYIP